MEWLEPVAGRLVAAGIPSRAELQQDPEGHVRGAAAPEQVSGLTEISLGSGKVGCFRLGKAKLAKLLGAPAENSGLLIEKTGILPSCCATRHPLVKRFPGL